MNFPSGQQTGEGGVGGSDKQQEGRVATLVSSPHGHMGTPLSAQQQ